MFFQSLITYIYNLFIAGWNNPADQQPLHPLPDPASLRYTPGERAWINRFEDGDHARMEWRKRCRNKREEEVGKEDREMDMDDTRIVFEQQSKKSINSEGFRKKYEEDQDLAKRREVAKMTVEMEEYAYMSGSRPVPDSPPNGPGLGREMSVESEDSELQDSDFDMEDTEDEEEMQPIITRTAQMESEARAAIAVMSQRGDGRAGVQSVHGLLMELVAKTVPPGYKLCDGDDEARVSAMRLGLGYKLCDEEDESRAHAMTPGLR